MSERRPGAELDHGLPRLYGELARWWPLLSAPADYAEEAELYRRSLLEACRRRPRTLLELGSGGGNNASHLKRHFRMTLSDASADMLAVSQALNPECEHVHADMRDAALGREFDAVFVHDAICYMSSEADLRRALGTAYRHCRPGGAALIAPDYVRESFRPSTEHGGHDAADGRGLRYLEWAWDPDPTDDSYVVDYAYLLRDADGATTACHDRHVEGLFARGTWLRLLTEVGFEPQVVPFEHSELDAPGEMFLARRTGR